MRQSLLFNPQLTNPAQAGGMAGGAYGALQAAPQYYQQLMQNKFLGPLLQQQLAQQQQQTQQMTAATPFAGQIAQNEALRLLPLGTIAQIMENNQLMLKYPWLGNELGGFTGNEFNRSLPPPFGTGSTPLTTRGATTPPTNSGGAPVPVSQQPTWYGNFGKDISSGFKAIGQDFGVGQSQGTTTPAATVVKSPQKSSTPNAQPQGSLNIPSSNLFQPAGQPAAVVPNAAAVYGVKNGLTDLRSLPGGRFIGKDKNGKYHTFG